MEYESSLGIIRTNVQALQMVRTALAVIRKIEGKDCIFTVLGVSGTIKALKKKHLSKFNSGAQ